ncbi:MAG TPA: hypothetical protein VIK91_00510 [Nannocystis sp.]
MLAVCLALGGCGPQAPTPGETGTGETTSGTTTAATSGGTTTGETTAEPTTGPSPTTTTGTGTTGPSDADLCVAWCLNANARGCAPPWAGETCYTLCRQRLEWAAVEGCVDEVRDVLACEAQADPPAEPACESLQCIDAYKRHDLCSGWCTHLGGWPGGVATPTTCGWYASCYGAEFEVVCPVGDPAGLCTCSVDGGVIAECEVGVSLAAYDCGGDELQILKTCCKSAFEGVLFP